MRYCVKAHEKAVGTFVADTNSPTSLPSSRECAFLHTYGPFGLYSIESTDLYHSPFHIILESTLVSTYQNLIYIMQDHRSHDRQHDSLSLQTTITNLRRQSLL